MCVCACVCMCASVCICVRACVCNDPLGKGREELLEGERTRLVGGVNDVVAVPAMLRSKGASSREVAIGAGATVFACGHGGRKGFGVLMRQVSRGVNRLVFDGMAEFRTLVGAFRRGLFPYACMFVSVCVRVRACVRVVLCVLCALCLFLHALHAHHTVHEAQCSLVRLPPRLCHPPLGAVVPASVMYTRWGMLRSVLRPRGHGCYNGPVGVLVDAVRLGALGRRGVGGGLDGREDAGPKVGVPVPLVGGEP